MRVCMVATFVVDICVQMMCEDADLKEMGLPLGPRKKLLSHLQELRQRQVRLYVHMVLVDLYAVPHPNFFKVQPPV